MDASTSKTGRREDLRLVSGHGKYTADWNLEGQAHAWFLHSDHAHAEIVSIDTSAALAVPGVLAVLTGADVAKAAFKTPPAIMFMKGKGGSSFKLPHRHALAHGRVRFVGEPVALVVAESEAAAQDGAERIAVEYRDLPAVIGAQAALAAGAPVQAVLRCAFERNLDIASLELKQPHLHDAFIALTAAKERASA